MPGPACASLKNNDLLETNFKTVRQPRNLIVLSEQGWVARMLNTPLFFQSGFLFLKGFFIIESSGNINHPKRFIFTNI